MKANVAVTPFDQSDKVDPQINLHHYIKKDSFGISKH